MAIEPALRNRIEELIAQAVDLSRTSEYGGAHNAQHAAQCEGWMAASVHAVQVASGGSPNWYLSATEKIAAQDHGMVIPVAVGAVAEILRRLLADIDAGLLGSVADRARAETFDDFLDHGRAYLREGKVQEAAVIVGVVFEDSVRRICRKRSIEEKGVKLDALISELVKVAAITELKAKRARVAASVRTKATHAQWDEFTESDVAEADAFTRELISDQLDG